MVTAASRRRQVRRPGRPLDRGSRWAGTGQRRDRTAGSAYADAADESASFAPDGITRADDPLLLYFTSGTTAQPKLVEHTHASYPVGHLSTMYWIGLQPGDVHLNISSPGWAKHAWSNVFAPWNAEATVLIVNHDALLGAARCWTRSAQCGVTTFCAPPTVWRMLIQADLPRPTRRRCARCVGAGEPLNPEVIEQVRRAWGITVRDGYGQTETTAQIGNPPGPAASSRARWAGRCPATPWSLVDPRHRRARATRARSAWTCPTARSG